MSKDTFYFSHDFNARSDPKLIRLAMKYGMQGIGIYWCLIEMLHEQDGYLHLNNLESIAYELHTECERIADILRTSDLFKFDGEKFYSESALRRLQKRKDKSKSASYSALKRWGNDANALRTHSEGNAIKERKGKEIKLNEKKEEYKSIFLKIKDSIFIPEGFEPLILEWLKYKSEKGQTYKQTGLKSFINSFIHDANSDQNIGREMLNYSMKNNYSGIFKIKTNGTSVKFDSKRVNSAWGR